VRSAKVDGITAAHPLKNIQKVAFGLKVAELSDPAN
jgi:hypothetical protein